MEAPTSITYSSSVRIGFLIAALNDLDIMVCDLENAYLNAPCREKIWFEGGAECGEDHGKVLVVVSALYGLKSAGSSWRAALAEVLAGLGFESTIADPMCGFERRREVMVTSITRCCLYMSTTFLLLVLSLIHI